MGKNELSLRNLDIGIFVIGLMFFVFSLLFPSMDEFIRRLIYVAVGGGAFLIIVNFLKKNTLEFIGLGAVVFILGSLAIEGESTSWVEGLGRVCCFCSLDIGNGSWILGW